jgi:hypothetical protein
MNLFLIAQVESGNPWWITAITGSGGALIVLMLWVRSQLTTIKKKDEELVRISRESIECITRMIEKHNQDGPWKLKIESLVQEIYSSMKSIEKGK